MSGYTPSVSSNGRSFCRESATRPAAARFGFTNSLNCPRQWSQLSLEMRSEYVVGYTPDAPRNDGRYHRVRITVQPPAGMAQVRTSWRRGYIAPNE